jgi:hypothetical protein
MTESMLEWDDTERSLRLRPTAYAATYVVFPAICCHKIQAPYAS